MTPTGIAYDPERDELWFAGEAAEAVLLELEARRRALGDEVAELERQAARCRRAALGRRRRHAVPAADCRGRAARCGARGCSRDRRSLGADASRQGRRGFHAHWRARRRAPPARRRRGGGPPRRGRGLGADERDRRRAGPPSGRAPRGRRGGSRPPVPSRPRATTARRSSSGRIAFAVGARSSDGSTRSPPRSTSARRSTSPT